IDGDGIELLRHAACRLDLPGDELAHVLQVDVAGHELREAVDHRDDRFAEIAVFHPRGAPQATGAGHGTAMGGGAGTVGRHRSVFRLVTYKRGRTRRTISDGGVAEDQIGNRRAKLAYGVAASASALTIRVSRPAHSAWPSAWSIWSCRTSMPR